MNKLSIYCCKTPVQSDNIVNVRWTLFSPHRKNKNYPHKNLPEGCALQTYYLAPTLNSQNQDQDGHQPSKINQKEVYYKPEFWHIGLTHKQAQNLCIGA